MVKVPNVLCITVMAEFTMVYDKGHGTAAILLYETTR